jgi:stage III sporulation protein AH
MVLHRRVIDLLLFVALVVGAAAFVAANWGKVSGHLGGTSLVSAPLSGTHGAGRARPGSGTAAAPAPATAAAADYFAAAHLQRAQAESRELEQLKRLAADASATAAVRAQAEEQILQLEQQQEEEAQAELVLQAKGYPQSLVLLRPGGATVVVQAAQFGAADAARIAQAVAAVAGVDPAQVQIVPRSG